MGRHPSGHRKYEVQQLQDNHREIVRRISLGQSNVEIARDMNITPQCVSIVRNSTVAKAEINRLQDKADEEVIDINKRIAMLRTVAVDVLEAILREESAASDGVKLRAAEAILDRGGSPKVAASTNEHIHTVHYTSAELAEIKQRVEDASHVIDISVG